jgi:hypothetical protein
VAKRLLIARKPGCALRGLDVFEQLHLVSVHGSIKRRALASLNPAAGGNGGGRLAPGKQRALA